MKITGIETYTVSAGWKNWLFIKVLTDTELYGIAEATINGFIKTTEAAVHELKHFAADNLVSDSRENIQKQSESLKAMSLSTNYFFCNFFFFSIILM